MHLRKTCIIQPGLEKAFFILFKSKPSTPLGRPKGCTQKGPFHLFCEHFTFMNLSFSFLSERRTSCRPVKIRSTFPGKYVLGDKTRVNFMTYWNIFEKPSNSSYLRILKSNSMKQVYSFFSIVFWNISSSDYIWPFSSWIWLFLINQCWQYWIPTRTGVASFEGQTNFSLILETFQSFDWLIVHWR